MKTLRAHLTKTAGKRLRFAAILPVKPLFQNFGAEGRGSFVWGSGTEPVYPNGSKYSSITRRCGSLINIVPAPVEMSPGEGIIQIQYCTGVEVRC